MNFLILGMPNVGKTSLYNLLTEDDNNIIHETSGTTRDWHEAKIKYKNINLFDTPGLIIDKNKIINKNFENLLTKIDCFLYVIDFKQDFYIADRDLINFFRKYNKRIVLVVNKDDNNTKDKDLNFFGIKEIFYTSCAHKSGIFDLFKFFDKFESINTKKNSYDYSIAIFGKTNVGKSTLLNNLVGFKRSIVSNEPKTTTDIVNSSFKFKNKIYLIKDTAGLIKKNRIDKDSLDYFSTKKTLSIIENINLNLFLIDTVQGFDTQSKKIFNIILNKSNLIILIINKIDLLKKDKSEYIYNLKKDINIQFSQSKNIHIFAICAKESKYISSLKNQIHKIINQLNITIPTSQMNNWLQSTITRNPHARVNGREVKFKYVTQVSSNPLIIKIFTNYAKSINSHYRRFLINQFCDHFKIKSKNIKIVFSRSDNPYG